MDSLQQLQQWFQRRCDGEWEHSRGIEIETIDNPGWLVTIDLAETEWAGIEVPRTVEERSPTDWIQFEVAASKFTGAGGPANLSEIVEAFFKVLQANQK